MLGLHDEDLYRLLGVATEASEDDIHDAYRDRCFLFHPDRLAGAPPRVRQRAEQELRRVNAAWEILGNAAARAAYDERRRAIEAAAVAGARVTAAEPRPARPRRVRRTSVRIPRRAAVASAGVGLALLAGWLAVRPYSAPASPSPEATAASPAIAPTPSPTRVPLLAGGGFEDTGAPWTLEAGIVRVAGSGRGGGVALRVPGDGGWSNGFATATLASSGCYALSAWVRGDGTARLDVLSVDWQPVASLRLTGAPVWTRHTITFSTGARTEFVVAVRDSESGPELLVDDLSLTRCEHD